MNDKDLIQCLRCSGRSVGDKEVCGEAAERLTALSGAALTRHPDDIAIYEFAAAMSTKMAEARAKGRSGWEECAPKELSRMLREHVEKGDPRDVANFCMMLWHHEAPIADCRVPKQAAADAQLLKDAVTVAVRYGEREDCYSSEIDDMAQSVIERINIILAATAQEQAPADNEQLIADAREYAVRLDEAFYKSGEFKLTYAAKLYRQLADALRSQPQQAAEKGGA